MHRRTLANWGGKGHFATQGLLPGLSGKLVERNTERRRLPPLNALRAFEAGRYDPAVMRAHALRFDAAGFRQQIAAYVEGAWADFRQGRQRR